MNLLETKGLEKSFGSLQAVNGVDFCIAKGELKSIIGPNGAGKTTFFNLLTGMFPPTGGQILFKGEDITGSTPEQVAGMGIGRSFQITSVFPELTVFENVFIPARRYYPKGQASFWVRVVGQDGSTVLGDFDLDKGEVVQLMGGGTFYLTVYSKTGAGNWSAKY